MNSLSDQKHSRTKNSNIVLLLCDSLIYNEDLLQKLDSLSEYKNNQLVFTNFFAQAPFTEAATVPMFSSNSVLSERGYLNNLKYKEININEVFQSYGYKTYNTVHFYPNTSSYLRGLDEYSYVSSFSVLTPFIDYRLRYYQELYSNKLFTEASKDDLIELIEDLFAMVETYLDDYKNNYHRMHFSVEFFGLTDQYITDFDMQFQKNKTEYLRDKDNYLESVLKGTNDFYQSHRFNIKKSEAFIKNLKVINNHINRISKKRMLTALLKGNKNNSWKSMLYTLKNINSPTVDINTVRKRLGNITGYGFEYQSGTLSANTLLNNTANYLDENKNQDNFVLCHLEDTHSPFNFLSYESDGVSEEIPKLIKQKKVSSNKNFYYEESIRYLNDQIGVFIENLKKMNIWDETTLILTSDHGSS